MTMTTPWTETIDRENPLPEYPRPQLAREGWINLNGPWDYAINDSRRFPQHFDGQILVPFSPETALSGVERTLKAGEYLWYRRCIALPESFSGKRLLLHFGAVAQIATVWVNAHQLTTHVGGCLPFEVEVTDAVEDGMLTITVRVSDDTERGGRTRGRLKTRRCGIWQTAWLEAVPESFVKSLRITPHFDEAEVEIEPELVGDEPAVAIFNGESYPLPGRIPVPDFEPWSPENPKLYGFYVRCGEDLVQSYFAMRKFSVEKDSKGITRLFLNGKPCFHNGLLDQGCWPDGLYTAPTDEAMIFDIRTAKESGFNMLRKHLKVEPLRWYYHCDRLGMLVWQDMSCGGGAWAYSPQIVAAPWITGIHLSERLCFLFGRAGKASRKELRAELAAMIRQLYNCPCIALWVLFSEGRGQLDAKEMLSLVKGLDKTRTIDHASGWHDQGIGQVRSEHVYFRPYSFKPDRRGRAVLLNGFGGYSHAVNGHVFSKKSFGYKRFETPAQLRAAIEELYLTQIIPAKEQGLAAAVYTQISDVGDELNGLMTYDRKVVKIAPEILKAITNVGIDEE